MSDQRAHLPPGEAVSDPGGVNDWRIANDVYRQWIDTTERSALAALAASPAGERARAAGPLISIVLPVFNTPEKLLHETLESILGQSYSRWELCVVDDGSSDPHVQAVLERYQSRDARIRYRRRDLNGGVSRASNDALTMVTGQYVALVDHDDLLALDALLLLAMDILAHPKARLWYSDSDNLDSHGLRCNPFFKPDWNYELLLGQNYFNHLTVYSAQLLLQLGGFREEFDASQDYDLALRAVERLAGHEIRHIPHVLYHWRVVENSVSRSDLGRACRVARMAVAEHLARTAQDAQVVPAEGAVIFNRVVRATPPPEPGISVLVYGDDSTAIAATAERLREDTGFGADRVEEALLASGDANSTASLNALCLSLSTPFICFIHAAVEPGQPDFFALMQAQLLRPGIGAVGARLVAQGSGLTSGPLRTGIGGRGIAPCCPGAAPESKGYFASLCLEQAATALHGAALALNRLSFNAVGGVSPGLGHPMLVGADICLKLGAHGQRVVWTPCARVNCPPDMVNVAGGLEPGDIEAALFARLWRDRLQTDLFYNPNFDPGNGCFQLPGG